MFVASEKRKENIAEYILYMWQIEDIIRAYDMDIDKIQANVIDQYSSLSPEKRKQLREWYESLIDMMRREEVTKNGHLQINKNIMSQLYEFHKALLSHPEFDKYSAEFYKTLPYIVELRAKAGDSKVDEIETCFNALYGMLVMRLGKREISEDTQKALAQIAHFIGMLSHYYISDEKEPLFKDDDK